MAPELLDEETAIDEGPHYPLGFSILVEILEHLAHASKHSDSTRLHLSTLIGELKKHGPEGPDEDTHLENLLANESAAPAPGQALATIDDIVAALKALPAAQRAKLASALGKGSPAVGSAGSAASEAGSAAVSSRSAAAVQPEGSGVGVAGSAGTAQPNIQEAIDAALKAQFEMLQNAGLINQQQAPGSPPSGEGVP